MTVIRRRDGDVQFLPPLNVSVVADKVIPSLSKGSFIKAGVLAFLGWDHGTDWAVQGAGCVLLFIEVVRLRWRGVLTELNSIRRF